MRTSEEFKISLKNFIKYNQDVWYLITMEDGLKGYVRFRKTHFDFVGLFNTVSYLVLVDLLIAPEKKTPPSDEPSLILEIDLIDVWIDRFFSHYDNMYIGTITYGEQRTYYVKDGRLYGIDFPSHLIVNHIGKVEWACQATELKENFYRLDEFLNYNTDFFLSRY